jgi:acetyl esterase/lipase
MHYIHVQRGFRPVTNFEFTYGQAAAVLAGLLLASPADAEDKTKNHAVKRVKDIAYYNGKDADSNKHKLDLYLPEGVKDFPVLVFVHGGAWVSGDRNFFGMYSSLANAYAKQGIGVAVTSYRLSPAVKHPEHVKDVARAFAWTYKNIAKYGGKPDQLFVSGHSAGGHLVALLASDGSYLAAHDLTTRAIRGVIAISGVYAVADRFLPRVFGSEDGSGKNASPLNFVKKGLPPFLILYADKDLVYCGKAPSEKFRKALDEAGTKARAMEVKESDHFMILFAAAKIGSDVSTAIVDFIRADGSR